MDQERREWDAELHHWMLAVPGSAPLVLEGSIFYDTKRRWPNGRLIRTSYLMTSAENVQSETVVSTTNSRYLVKGDERIVLQTHGSSTMLM